MKKALSLILALVMCLSLCACGSKSDCLDTEVDESYFKEGFDEYFSVNYTVADYGKTGEYGAKMKVRVKITPKTDERGRYIEPTEDSMQIAVGLGNSWKVDDDEIQLVYFEDGNYYEGTFVAKYTASSLLQSNPYFKVDDKFRGSIESMIEYIEIKEFEGIHHWPAEE